MRTTRDIPEDVISEAMKAARMDTKTKAIITVLEEVIRKSKISGLKKFKGEERSQDRKQKKFGGQQRSDA